MSNRQKPQLTAALLVSGSASDPLPGLPGQLDLSAREALNRAIDGRAKAWAATISATEPVETDLKGLAGLADGARSLVVIRPSLIGYGKELAADIEGDIQHGCGLVLGPTLTSGWYLLALAPTNLALLTAAADGGPGSAGGLLAAAREVQGLEAGLLRAERDLVSEADLLAAKADPLIDAELAALIS